MTFSVRGGGGESRGAVVAVSRLGVDADRASFSNAVCEVGGGVSTGGRAGDEPENGFKEKERVTSSARTA